MPVRLMFSRAAAAQKLGTPAARAVAKPSASSCSIK